MATLNKLRERKNSMPYVYRLTHRNEGYFYIGYRGANTEPSHIDLPIYQSSSLRVKELGFENFDWEIIAEFYNSNDAYDFENQLISENINDPLCINGNYTVLGEARFKTPTSLPKSTRDKISNALRGIKRSDETRNKLSNSHRAKRVPLSTETKDKLSKFNMGHSVSEETRKKISDTKKLNPYVLDILVCNYCGKSGKSSGGMVRYHFENCKEKYGNDE